MGDEPAVEAEFSPSKAGGHHPTGRPRLGRPGPPPRRLQGFPTEPSPDGGSGHISGLNRFQHASIPFMTVSRRLEASLTSRSRQLAAIKAKKRPSIKR